MFGKNQIDITRYEKVNASLKIMVHVKFYVTILKYPKGKIEETQLKYKGSSNINAAGMSRKIDKQINAINKSFVASLKNQKSIHF